MLLSINVMGSNLAPLGYRKSTTEETKEIIEWNSTDLPNGVENGGGVTSAAVRPQPDLDTELFGPHDVEGPGAEAAVRVGAVADAGPGIPDPDELVVAEVDAVSQDRLVGQQACGRK